MICVFYDRQCGLCRREIQYYQRLARPGIFIWDDITSEDSGFHELSIPLTEGLKNLHVLDDEGVLHRGVDAFAVIWRRLPYWRVVARVVMLPGVYWMTCLLYRLFAQWRYKRITYCRVNDDK